MGHALVIFQRNLRVGCPELTEALRISARVSCVHVYCHCDLGDAVRRFEEEAVADLERSLRVIGLSLIILRGDPNALIPALYRDVHATVVFREGPHMCERGPTPLCETNGKVRGGRTAGLRRLYSLNRLADIGYHRARHYPAIPTSGLGPYLAWGCLSLDEVHDSAIAHMRHNRSARDTFIRELRLVRSYRRHIGQWNPSLFAAWCQGRTGVPIVDAVMRELASTGYAHRSARMVAMSHLIYGLGVGAQYGADWFARNAIDAGIPEVTRADPERWAIRYDPDAVYIRRWVPELRRVSRWAALHWRRAAHGMTPARLADIGYPCATLWTGINVCGIRASVHP
jgi:deoxyribodipyrimidine photolyase